MKQRHKKSFTLLELMVCFSLLIFAGSVFGWKMHTILAKKRFSASIEKLSSRFLGVRTLAMNTQSDWKGVLYRQGESWVFESGAEDDLINRLPLLSLQISEVFWEGKKIERHEFDFSSTGDVVPEGRLEFCGASGRIQWKVPELFGLQEGKKLGPMHPDDALLGTVKQ